MESKLSFPSECIWTKHCKLCTSFISNLHGVCGMVWYRTPRVNNDDDNNNNNNNNNNNDDDDDDNDDNNNNRIKRRNSRFFYNLLIAPRTVSNTYAEVAQVQSHRALIMCNMSCYLPRATKGQLSYYVWQSWNRIYFSFILLAEPLNRRRRGGNRSTRRKPLATSFRKCHIPQPEDSSPKRDSNPHSSTGGRLGKQTY